MATATRKRRVSRTKNRPTWAAMARAAGAVYPRGHSKAGKVMSKNDALMAEIPVKFFLTPGMIKGWKKGGGNKDKKAVRSLKRKSRTQAKRRRARSVSWPKARTKKYLRGGKKGKKTAKGRYRPRMGGVTTIKLYRGASLSKKQAKALRDAGYVGSLRSKGGTAMKLNPRRRRRRRKTSATSSRGKKVRRRSRRRKAARRNPPKRRKARRRKTNRGYGYKKNPGRKRRRRARRGRKKGHAVAKRRKNPVRRRRRRYRRNPGILAALGLDQVMKQSVWIFGGQAVLGMGATALICDTLQRQQWVPMALKGRGGSVALCAISSGLTFAGAKLVQNVLPKGKLTNNMPANMLAGGVIYTLINGIYAFAPGLFTRLRLPSPAPSGADMAGLGRVYDGPYGRGGSYPGQYPGYGGMGSVESANALVEGESLSRQVSAFDGMGDWMELSGMAGSPVPIEDLRGMGDWVEMNPSAGLVQAGFSPGNESF